MFKSLIKYLNLLVNSLIYITYRRPVVVSAYVDIVFGKVRHRNWGDDINVFLLEAITRRKVVVANESLYDRIFPRTNYLSIGSTVGFMVNEKTIVCGAGAMYPYNSLSRKPRHVSFVRGPLTRKVMLDSGLSCPEIYGDPALLISRFYSPKAIPDKYKLGIVLHIMDESNEIVREWISRHDDAIVINMSQYDLWTDIPDKIASCKAIVSSSLHGLIVSDAYGIPNRWVRLSSKISGGDFKFNDYLMSVKRENLAPFVISSVDDLEELYVTGIEKEAATFDSNAILNQLPFVKDATS